MVLYLLQTIAHGKCNSLWLMILEYRRIFNDLHNDRYKLQSRSVNISKYTGTYQVESFALYFHMKYNPDFTSEQLKL
mgnify:FL=1